MKFRFYLSLIIAKLAYIFLSVTKLSGGTAIIGLITLKICPNFLLYVNDYIKNARINITGTNGKTTTSGMISHLILNNSKTLINNAIGANMLNGIVNAMAVQINPFRTYEYSVIETDEAFVEKVYKKLGADYLLVTNLFEDQTDRFETPIVTRDLIQKGIDLRKDVQLILNADDPISAGLKSSKEPIYFGIENVYDETGLILCNEPYDYSCPLCQKKLTYQKYFYSQLGHYSCECGYSRKNVKYGANVTLYKDHMVLSLDNEKYEIPLVGLFNAYNALGAIVLAKELGLKNVNDALKTFKVAFGRNEKRVYCGHNTTIQLIKNPAGTNEVLKTINLDSTLLLAVNNKEADGTDFSWINQVDFEKLSSVKKEVVVCGLCADKMAKRLNDAGVSAVKIISDIDKAVRYVGESSDGDITILTTYTALLKIDKIKEMKKCF